MSESDFAHVAETLMLLGLRRALRVCDFKEARGGLYGLRAITRPIIKSTGADYLVLPHSGMRTVLARDSGAIVDALKEHEEEAFFLELKDPMAKKRKDQSEQEAWMRWVGGKK